MTDGDEDTSSTSSSSSNSSSSSSSNGSSSNGLVNNFSSCGNINISFNKRSSCGIVLRNSEGEINKADFTKKRKSKTMKNSTSKKGGKSTKPIQRRRPSEDPGITAEREYKKIWKNKEQVFRALERLEEITNMVQCEEEDITDLTEEVDWLVEQVTLKDNEMIGSSSTVAQLETQQLIVDVEGESYTERSNGHLKSISKEEIRVYAKLETLLNAIIDAMKEDSEEELAAWATRTKRTVLTELERAQKMLFSKVSDKSLSQRKNSRRLPLLLRHESFIVKENTPVDQAAGRGILQRQVSVPYIRRLSKCSEAPNTKPIARERISSLSSGKGSPTHLYNEPAHIKHTPQPSKDEKPVKSNNDVATTTTTTTTATNTTAATASSGTDEDRKKRKDDKKKRKKQKTLKDSDDRLSSSRGSESKADTSSQKEEQEKDEDVKMKMRAPNRVKSVGEIRKQSNLTDEGKPKPRKSKAGQNKKDTTEDSESEDRKARRKKEKDEESSDELGDDTTSETEQDGKSHKMRSRFGNGINKLAQVFHKSRKATKGDGTTQPPAVRLRTSSPQPGDGQPYNSPVFLPPHLTQSHSPVPSLSPPSPSMSSSANAENSTTSPTQDTQESSYKEAMIRTLITLNLTTKDYRTLWAMDTKTFIGYYETKVLQVKEKLDGKE